MLGVEENKNKTKQNKTKRVRYLICFFVFQCTCNSTNVFELEDTQIVVSLVFMSTLLAFLVGARVSLSLMSLNLIPVGARVP